jgi:hypothetical protein
VLRSGGLTTVNARAPAPLRLALNGALPPDALDAARLHVLAALSFFVFHATQQTTGPPPSLSFPYAFPYCSRPRVSRPAADPRLFPSEPFSRSEGARWAPGRSSPAARPAAGPSPDRVRGGGGQRSCRWWT